MVRAWGPGTKSEKALTTGGKTQKKIWWQMKSCIVCLCTCEVTAHHLVVRVKKLPVLQPRGLRNGPICRRLNAATKYQNGDNCHTSLLHVYIDATVVHGHESELWKPFLLCGILSVQGWPLLQLSTGPIEWTFADRRSWETQNKMNFSWDQQAFFFFFLNS